MFDVLRHKRVTGAERGSQPASSGSYHARPAYNPLLAAMLGAGVICGGPETRMVRKNAPDPAQPNRPTGSIFRASQQSALILRLRGLITLAPAFRLGESM
jgi:hypothetical protein